VSWPEEFAPGAIRDVEGAVDWFYDRGGPDVARRMAVATVEAARRIVERPLMGHARPDVLPAPFRFWAVSGFPYLLVYDASAAPPKVLRVLHTSRDLPPLLVELRDAPPR
jgi:plasmid stabilization system protein ParE